MVYPEWFKEKVKSYYPAEDMQRALDSGNDELVGFYLKSGSHAVVQGEQILKCESLDEVQKLAHRVLDKKSLYEEYLELRRK